MLGILIEQALAAKVEEICVVVWPGDEARYAQAAGSHAGAVRVRAPSRGRWATPMPSIARASSSAAIPSSTWSAIIFMSAPAQARAGSVVEIAAGREVLRLRRAGHARIAAAAFGAVAGRAVAGRQGLYRVETVIEKPTPTEAEQRLVVSGMRAGYYLCFFGIHALTPAVMELLGPCRGRLAGDARLRFRPCWRSWRGANSTWRWKTAGRRYDMGARYGLLTSQLALALNGRDRGEVLAHLVELLADRELAAGRRIVSRLIEVITARPMRQMRDRSLDAVCAGAAARRTAGGMRGAGPVPALERQPL